MLMIRIGGVWNTPGVTGQDMPVHTERDTSGEGLETIKSLLKWRADVNAKDSGSKISLSQYLKTYLPARFAY
jgi:hypothetical protein